MADFSDYTENAIMNAIGNATAFSVATPYISLHTADPGETGANEVAGGSYARQSGSFGASSNGTISNDAQIEFTSMPAVTVTHVGVWDALSGGNFIMKAALGASKAVNSGDTARILTGELDLSAA